MENYPSFKEGESITPYNLIAIKEYLPLKSMLLSYISMFI